ncbi:discoidin domain-containing protein [Bacteroides salyersiae]|uniref:MGH1-like glycoside hydrolase domain-containing protein n=1 Tax=Bacteroides salyersiae TaxID=291644 RepID=UPI001C37E7FD|nr:discoidin domain-containing protein [Bacteroides salyersiae]MBV4204738.1 discoidin domain-containing protein [Bacteroides salyersiae]MCB6650069.1 discoidin domain-containing protein [Bacteroides salyersiae]
MRKLLTLFLCLFTLIAKAEEFSKIYVVGAAFDCGWTAEKAYLMDDEGNGIFTWTGKMKRNDFKFLLKTNPNDIWIDCLNAEVANEAVVIGKEHKIRHVENSRVTNDDYKFIMNDEGSFKITIDTRKMTMIVTPDDLISVSALDGRGKRIVNIYSCSGKASDSENAYKLLLNKDEINNNKSNKWAYKGDDPWVIFSLPAIYSINKFGFRDGRILETGSDVYNLPEYKVYVSTTGTAEADWTEIIHETNVGDLDTKVKRITPVEARYIKFVPVKDTRDSYVRIYGVDIYGSYVRPLNEEIVSTGKTIVDYHNSWSNRETPANIIDGNTDAVDGEDANNPWAFGKKEGTDGWVVIDLEQEYEINKFALIDSEEWLTGYKVYACSFAGTDEDWKLVFDGTFEAMQVRKEGVPAEPFASRFLKLEIPSEYQKGLARIREFEVYGKPAVQPEIISNNADLKAAYELALWTVNINTTQNGILNAGARYDGNWTRDLSINVWNGFPLLQPEISKNSLLHLLEDNEQEYIGAEYWDKIIWVKGAYMYYQMTGDKEFLNQILKSGVNTIHQLEEMKRDNNPVYDSQYGLFTGPSVFNDGIAGYEEPVWSGDSKGGAVVSHPAHNKIKCLSTNCIYYEAYRLLAHIATILGEEETATEMEKKAENLKTNIRTHLFDRETGKFNYLIDQNGDLHSFQEGLGNSFAILFDIVSPAEAEKIISQMQVTKFGLPSIYPHFKRFSDEKPGRHNMMIWPFVNAFYADACTRTGDYERFTFELFNLVDLGLNKGGNDFWEIYDPKDGYPDGGWQTGSHWGGLQHQTWSATGLLRMVWYGLVGMRFEDEKLRFEPFLPEEVNSLELTRLNYGNMILNVKLEGEGNRIKEFKLNGIAMDTPEIPQNLTGEQTVSIVLEKSSGVGVAQLNQDNSFFTLTPDEGRIRVQLKNDYRADIVTLFDMSGKSIVVKKKQSGNFYIGSNLHKGIYTVSLECNKEVYSQKVIIP